MAFLARNRKIDLMSLADDLDIMVLPTDKIVNITKKITESANYDDVWAKNRLEQIVEEREAEAEAEAERLKLEAERIEREEVRRHELEVLRLNSTAEASSVVSHSGEGRRGLSSLKSVMQPFNAEKSDMALFLTLFQRQAKKAGCEDDELVTQLLALLPVEIAEIIIREPEEKANDFDHVKQLLLDRFKLSPEAFRTKFTQHQRRPGSLWRDLIFELRSYLEGWLEGVKISNFEELRNLMIADQIKRRVPAEMREFLIDEWTNLVDPEVLATKLDSYEAVRKPLRRPVPSKVPEKRAEEKFHDEENRFGNKGSEYKNRDVKRKDRENAEEDPPRRHINWRNENFEKRRVPRCYECNSEDHLRPSCPRLRDLKTDIVNHLNSSDGEGNWLKPYMSFMEINGQKMKVLRDSGSSLDIISKKHVCDRMFLGKEISVKQPLDHCPRKLPLARIKIKGLDFGEICTEAAVISANLDMGYYLLGNRTAELIEKRKNQRINASADYHKSSLKREEDGIWPSRIKPPEGRVTNSSENGTSPTKDKRGVISSGDCAQIDVNNGEKEGVSKPKLEFVRLHGKTGEFDFGEAIQGSKLKGHLNSEQKESLKRVLKGHKKMGMNGPGKNNLIIHDILVSRDKIQSTEQLTVDKLKAEVKNMLDHKQTEIGELNAINLGGGQIMECMENRKLNTVTRTEVLNFPNDNTTKEQVSLLDEGPFKILAIQTYNFTVWERDKIADKNADGSNHPV